MNSFNFSNIVRSNNNAVMFFVSYGSSKTYYIFDMKKQSISYNGTLTATKKAWNRNYANTRQRVMIGRHDYLSARTSG